LRRTRQRRTKHPSWWLEYDKPDKTSKRVADLKAPPAEFREYLTRCVDAWCNGDDDAAAYAASFGTSNAKDRSKGNTKPTAFHFTAANQQFLGTAAIIRDSVTAKWARQSLFEGNAERSGYNLRWDPAAERNWALIVGSQYLWTPVSQKHSPRGRPSRMTGEPWITSPSAVHLRQPRARA
jgi:hypothetical protein